LIKKYISLKWDAYSKISLKIINESIAKYLVLVSPNYSKNFHFFCFAYNNTIVGVFLQKNDQDEEKLIEFMSKFLIDYELNYSIMEKKAYTLVKSLKNFITYVGYSKANSYVPCLAVKHILA